LDLHGAWEAAISQRKERDHVGTPRP